MSIQRFCIRLATLSALFWPLTMHAKPILVCDYAHETRKWFRLHGEQTFSTVRSIHELIELPLGFASQNENEASAQVTLNSRLAPAGYQTTLTIQETTESGKAKWKSTMVTRRSDGTVVSQATKDGFHRFALNREQAYVVNCDVTERVDPTDKPMAEMSSQEKRRYTYLGGHPDQRQYVRFGSTADMLELAKRFMKLEGPEADLFRASVQTLTSLGYQQFLATPLARSVGWSDSGVFKKTCVGSVVPEQRCERRELYVGFLGSGLNKTYPTESVGILAESQMYRDARTNKILSIRILKTSIDYNNGGAGTSSTSGGRIR